MIYIRGALYVLCMAINRLYPNAKIRTEYQLHNAMYINITNLELTDDMVKDIEEEMKDIVDKNYEIIKKAFTKEEAEEGVNRLNYDFKINLRNLIEINFITNNDISSRESIVAHIVKYNLFEDSETREVLKEYNINYT